MCLLHLSVNIFWERTVKNMLRIYLNARKHTGKILQSDMKRKGGERGTSCWQWPLVFKWYFDMRRRVWKIGGGKKVRRWKTECNVWPIKKRMRVFEKAFPHVHVRQLFVCVYTCSPLWSVAGWWSPHRRRWSLWADWWPTDQSQRTWPQRGGRALR